MVPSPKYAATSKTHKPPPTTTNTQPSTRRTINSRPQHLVLPTPPPPHSRNSPTRHRPTLPRNLQHRPPHHHPLPPNPLLRRARPHRQRLLHPRLRRPHPLRLHAPRPTNRPSPRLPTPPRPKQRPRRLQNSLHRQRDAAPLQRGRDHQSKPVLARDGRAEEYHLRTAATAAQDGEYRPLAADPVCRADGWPR